MADRNGSEVSRLRAFGHLHTHLVEVLGPREHALVLELLTTALETQQPYLVIDNIAVRPLNAFRGFKPGPGQEPELNLQLDVSAWAYPEPAKPAAAPAPAAKT